VDREHLARLLDGRGEVFDACRRTVLAGARFWVSIDHPPTPAPILMSIYDRRERHTRRIGLPTSGFAAAVDALREWGDNPVRIGAVDVADPPYHFQLFFDDGLTAVVACLGVDQRLGYRLRPGDSALLGCEVVGWVSDDFPGWVRVRVTDAAGRAWDVVDKAPVFGIEVDAGSDFPLPAVIRCTVVDVVQTQVPDRPPWLVVSTSVDGVATEDGTDRFTVTGELLRRAAHV
jgi:hypothetical protein